MPPISSRSPYLFAFEQYRTREDLYDTHFNSAAMRTFLAKIPATMTTGLDLTHYEDSSGFLNRHRLTHYEDSSGSFNGHGHRQVTSQHGDHLK
ncbi:hypothetical protein PV05_10311 [Exophiala xenobiotica]|uniref:ABM domain-containing protein n=1 Tax=Exophiala xenobiotica TaxID=348802 RepID=A0A0D2CNY3_9EURO|nr:uncharacterized protein PV05_10311 [Exophiala xenobiotica]KIW51607.1 hypothetical protein PV05_10311 [Exophiala xenobiotica]